jgi:hypothetical protein
MGFGHVNISDFSGYTPIIPAADTNKGGVLGSFYNMLYTDHLI